MSTAAQFINEADSKPILSLKQDNMLGGYIYTLGRVAISKATFMDACCFIDWDLSKITERINEIREIYKWKGLVQVEINNIKQKIQKIKREIPLIIRDLVLLHKDYYKLQKLTLKNEFNFLHRKLQEYRTFLDSLPDDKSIERLASDNLLYTGHGLFSVILPNSFEYRCDTKLSPDGKPFVISRGVLLSGTIGKVAIGSSSGSLTHHLYKDYGAKIACDFVTHYQRFTNVLLSRRGFSIGIEDCIPKDTELMQVEQDKCFLQAKYAMENELDLELRENKILGNLNSATKVGEEIAKKSLNKNNNFLSMILSGAKGSIFNVIHSVKSIGQQNVEGKRIPLNCNGRTLPHFLKEKDIIKSSDNTKEINMLYLQNIFRSRGYITSSFYSGLTPQENFFLSAGGREGLTDTSIKTARCGYISRRILKLLEDVKISYNSTVVNAKGNVVQFCYGYDNYSSSELIKTEKSGYQNTDISHLTDMLNSEFEWQNRK